MNNQTKNSALDFKLVDIGLIKGEPVKVYANTPKLTKTQMHSLAWCLCDSIRTFYANPENMAKYEKWLADKRAKEAENMQADASIGGQS